MSYIIYNPTTGEIVSTVSVPDGDLPFNVPTGMSMIPDAGKGDDEISFVNIGTSPHSHQAKQPLEVLGNTDITANGEDAALLEVPQYTGIKVTVPDGTVHDLTDPFVIFKTIHPGAYVLRFSGVQWLTTEVVVHAS